MKVRKVFIDDSRARETFLRTTLERIEERGCPIYKDGRVECSPICASCLARESLDFVYEAEEEKGWNK